MGFEFRSALAGDCGQELDVGFECRSALASGGGQEQDVGFELRHSKMGLGLDQTLTLI